MDYPAHQCDFCNRWFVRAEVHRIKLGSVLTITDEFYQGIRILCLPCFKGIGELNGRS